jgi:hypothetical protein
MWEQKQSALDNVVKDGLHKAMVFKLKLITQNRANFTIKMRRMGPSENSICIRHTRKPRP